MVPKGSAPRTGQASPPKPPLGCTISAVDVEYLKARGVSRATAEAAGWYTATKPSHVPAAFARRQRQNIPALIAPHLSPTGAVGYQKRDHYPGKDHRGRLKKWVSPKGARPVLAVHPWTADEARTGTGALWAVEGITRLLALAERGIPAVSYAGCYTWQKDGEPLEDWRAVNLGRLVYDVPDADARTNWQVQTTQAARVPYFETRGARVLAVRVPEVDGDERAGLDDYLGAGGDLEALARSAAPFERVDVAAERLSRDETLRGIVAEKMREADELPARKEGECNRRKVARFLAGTLAPVRGKVRPGGVVEVVAGFAEIAEGVRFGSLQTVSKALDGLDETGFLVIQRAPKGGRAASSYLLRVNPPGVCTQGVNVGGRGVGGKESQKGRGEDGTPLTQRDSHASLHSTYTLAKSAELPALRNSKLVHTFERKGGRRVVVDSQYFKRYGAKGELIIRHVLERGAVETAELWEKFGARTSRLPGFFDTWIKQKVKDGVFRGDLESVEMAPDWREALEGVRRQTDEDEDNRLQSEKYARRRRARRERMEAERRGDVPAPEPTPELAGRERVAEIFAADAERDHAARVEEQRRKVGTTAETFIADALEGVSGFAFVQLLDLWAEKGGKRTDLWRVARAPGGPWTLRREDGDGPLYVERRAAGSYVRTQKTREGESLKTTPQKAPAEVVPMRPENEPHASPENPTKPHPGAGLDPFRNTPRPDRWTVRNSEAADVPRKLAPKVDGVYRHGPECACWMCGGEAPAEHVQVGASA